MDTEGFSVEHGPGPADADARNARRCRTDDPLPPVEALSHPVGDPLQRLTIWRRKERFSPLQLVHYELRQNEAPFAVLAASNAHPLERSMVITRENDALPAKVRLGKLRWRCASTYSRSTSTDSRSPLEPSVMKRLSTKYTTVV